MKFHSGYQFQIQYYRETFIVYKMRVEDYILPFFEKKRTAELAGCYAICRNNGVDGIFAVVVSTFNKLAPNHCSSVWFAGVANFIFPQLTA